MSWDPMNNLCGSVGVNLYRLNSIPTMSPPNSPIVMTPTTPWEKSMGEGENHFLDDIALIMHRRALNDYGKLVRLVCLRMGQNDNAINSFSLTSQKTVT